MKKQFPLRLDESLKTSLEKLASNQKRSLNQQIEKVLEDFIDNHECDKRSCQNRISVNIEDL